MPLATIFDLSFGRQISKICRLTMITSAHALVGRSPAAATHWTRLHQRIHHEIRCNLWELQSISVKCLISYWVGRQGALKVVVALRLLIILLVATSINEIGTAIRKHIFGHTWLKVSLV